MSAAFAAGYFSGGKSISLPYGCTINSFTLARQVVYAMNPRGLSNQCGNIGIEVAYMMICKQLVYQHFRIDC